MPMVCYILEEERTNPEVHCRQQARAGRHLFADTYYTFRGLHGQLHTIKKDVEHVICPRGTVSGSCAIQERLQRYK